MPKIPATLEAWLDYIENLHPESIALGLDRVTTVFRRLCPVGLDKTVVTIAGTNGKGSTVAFLESMLSAAGYRVGSYTSPHLIRFNERVRINLEEVDNATLCAAFMDVENARHDIALTYFEFITLAALLVFSKTPLDVIVLEVGMGGRLDAVNIIDAHVSVITPVDLDHMEWLGRDREAIGREKAGILRQGRPVVLTDYSPPQSILDRARELDASVYRINEEFRVQGDGRQWHWHVDGVDRNSLPLPAMCGSYQIQNAAGALMALQILADSFVIDQQAVRTGLLSARLPGRFQILPGPPQRILDVAHNPQASSELARILVQKGVPGSTIVVVGMLRDKNIDETLKPLLPLADQWICVTPQDARALSAEEMQRRIKSLVPGASTAVVADPVLAYRTALDQAAPQDRLLVFGSFYVVGDILRTEAKV